MLRLTWLQPSITRTIRHEILRDQVCPFQSCVIWFTKWKHTMEWHYTAWSSAALRSCIASPALTSTNFSFRAAFAHQLCVLAASQHNASYISIAISISPPLRMDTSTLCIGKSGREKSIQSTFAKEPRGKQEVLPSASRYMKASGYFVPGFPAALLGS